MIHRRRIITSAFSLMHQLLLFRSCINKMCIFGVVKCRLVMSNCFDALIEGRGGGTTKVFCQMSDPRICNQISCASESIITAHALRLFEEGANIRYLLSFVLQTCSHVNETKQILSFN